MCFKPHTPPPPPPPPPPAGGLLCWPLYGGGLGVSLTLCCFVVCSTRRFVVCRSVCHFVLVFFNPFSIAIASLGEERASLSAFRAFVRFVLVWICGYPLPLGVWKELRFVIVALPGHLLLFLQSCVIDEVEHTSVVRYLMCIVLQNNKRTHAFGDTYTRGYF